MMKRKRKIQSITVAIIHLPVRRNYYYLFYLNFDENLRVSGGNLPKPDSLIYLIILYIIYILYSCVACPKESINSQTVSHIRPNCPSFIIKFFSFVPKFHKVLHFLEDDLNIITNLNIVSSQL